MALVAEEDTQHALDILVGKHNMTIRGKERVVHVYECKATCLEEVETLGTSYTIIFYDTPPTQTYLLFIGFRKIPNSSPWCHWTEHRRIRKAWFDFVSVKEKRVALTRSINDLPRPLPPPDPSKRPSYPLSPLWCVWDGAGSKRQCIDSGSSEEGHRSKRVRTATGDDETKTDVPQVCASGNSIGGDGMDIDVAVGNEMVVDVDSPGHDNMDIDIKTYMHSTPCEHVMEDIIFFEC